MVKTIKKLSMIAIISGVLGCGPDYTNIHGKEILVEGLGGACDRIAIGEYFAENNKSNLRLVYGKLRNQPHSWLEKKVNGQWEAYKTTPGTERMFKVTLKYDDARNIYYKRYQWIGNQ